MKSMRFALLVATCIVSMYVHGQDLSLATDSVFKDYMVSLKNKGNDCYAQYDRLGVSQVISDYKQALAQRKSAGMLDAADEACYMMDLWKLQGDFYYLQSDYADYPQEVAEAYKNAEQNYKSYLHACQAQESHSGRMGEYMAHRELGQLYYKQERYLDAVHEMEMAVNGVVNFISDEDMQYDVLVQYAICLARTGQYEEALSCVDEVLGIYEEKGSSRFAEVLRKKAKILMLREEQDGINGSAEARDCYKKYFSQKKTDALKRFMGMPSQEREQYWLGIRPFVVDCYRIENADAELLYDVTLFAKGLLLQLDSAGGGRLDIHVTWQMVQQSLKPDACAIEFVQYEKYGQQQMGALVLKKTGVPVFVKMASPDSVWHHVVADKTVLERLAKTDRAQFNAIDQVYNDSTGLFRIIWNAALVEAIGNVNKVYFAPDGYIHRIAVEYMLPEEVSAWEMFRLTSTRRLLQQTSATGGKALIVGAVNYAAKIDYEEGTNDALAYRNMGRVTFGNLKTSRQEVETIMASRQSTSDVLLVGDKATEH